MVLALPLALLEFIYLVMVSIAELIHCSLASMFHEPNSEMMGQYKFHDSKMVYIAADMMRDDKVGL